MFHSRHGKSTKSPNGDMENPKNRQMVTWIAAKVTPLCSYLSQSILNDTIQIGKKSQEN